MEASIKLNRTFFFLFYNPYITTMERFFCPSCQFQFEIGIE